MEKIAIVPNMPLDIQKLLSKGERITLECKKATRNVPSSLWDTYSAFANTYGGIFYLVCTKTWKKATYPKDLKS